MIIYYNFIYNYKNKYKLSLMAESKNSSYFKPFLFGAISGCSAAAIIMPIDTLKVRI